jgi:hypothetical protein
VEVKVGGERALDCHARMLDPLPTACVKTEDGRAVCGHRHACGHPSTVNVENGGRSI